MHHGIGHMEGNPLGKVGKPVLVTFCGLVITGDLFKPAHLGATETEKFVKNS